MMRVALLALLAALAACSGPSLLDVPSASGAPDPSPAPHGPAPHGTIGTDVSKLGLPPPDPKRHIDPSHWVEGTIRIGADHRAAIVDGTPVFVVAKRIDSQGKPSGPPLAVRRMTWRGDQLPFNLTEAQAMIAGTELTGDVIVTAHYDRDGDALTRQPGDLLGQVRVTIPARDVELVLDTAVP
ncbi:MAG TPA: hypothetical protein VMJ10_34320 [Kofleriaceae bacterium]|nr:hypothetical protein [Kofleriaceae bacterium]